MSIRVLRKRRHTKSTNRPTPALTFTLRATVPVGSGAHARYAVGVGEGKIDRAAWADLMTDLIRSETSGKKAPFARLIGVDTRTLDRWLRREVDVREESVRAVARNLDRRPMDLLVRVGYYQLNDVSPPAPVDPREDPVIQAILGNRRLNENEKTMLVKREIERIERERAQRLADYEWYLQQRRAEGTA